MNQAELQAPSELDDVNTTLGGFRGTKPLWMLVEK